MEEKKGAEVVVREIKRQASKLLLLK